MLHCQPTPFFIYRWEKFIMFKYIAGILKRCILTCSWIFSMYVWHEIEACSNHPSICFSSRGRGILKWCIFKSNFNKLIFPFPLSTFSQYKRLMLKKNYSSRLIFHLSFPFIFSQSPIISLQSPIERGDITSPFPWKEGKINLLEHFFYICWN